MQRAVGGQAGVAGRGRDAEVGEAGVPVRLDQHVGGLHVAVHDAGAVGGLERGEDVEADPGHRGRRQRPLLLDDLLQAARGDVLHHQPGPAVLLDHVVDAWSRGGGPAGRRRGPRACVRSRRIVRSSSVRSTEKVTSFSATSPLQHPVGGQPHRAHAAAADHLATARSGPATRRVRGPVSGPVSAAMARPYPVGRGQDSSAGRSAPARSAPRGRRPARASPARGRCRAAAGSRLGSGHDPSLPQFAPSARSAPR